MRKRKPIPKAIRHKVLSRFGGRCGYCGDMAPKLQVDHIIPHARGHQYERKGVDLDAIENLMPACRKCNNFKHNNSLEGFRRDLGESIARARKYSVNFNNAERFGLISIHPQERIIFHFEKIGGTVDL